MKSETTKGSATSATGGLEDIANPVGKQTPRRMRRAVEILTAARESFLEKGFDRSSVGEIAAKVGVVEGLVYSYYPTKRDLLNDVLRAMYEPLIQGMEESFSRIQGVRSRLRFLIWRHLRVYVEETNLSRLVLHEVRTGPEYFKSVLHDLHVRYTAFLVRTIKEAIADGEIRPETDVELLRSMVYGGIEHRMWGTLFGHDTVDVEATADEYTSMVLGPLLPDGRGHSPLVPLSVQQDMNQILTEVRERLDLIEQAVVRTPANPSSNVSRPVPGSRKRSLP